MSEIVTLSTVRESAPETLRTWADSPAFADAAADLQDAVLTRLLWVALGVPGPWTPLLRQIEPLEARGPLSEELEEVILQHLQRLQRWAHQADPAVLWAELPTWNSPLGWKTALSGRPHQHAAELTAWLQLLGPDALPLLLQQPWHSGTTTALLTWLQQEAPPFETWSRAAQVAGWRSGQKASPEEWTQAALQHLALQRPDLEALVLPFLETPASPQTFDAWLTQWIDAWCEEWVDAWPPLAAPFAQALVAGHNPMRPTRWLELPWRLSHTHAPDVWHTFLTRSQSAHPATLKAALLALAHLPARRQQPDVMVMALTIAHEVQDYRLARLLVVRDDAPPAVLDVARQHIEGRTPSGARDEQPR